MYPVIWSFTVFGKEIRLYSFGLVVVIAFLAASFWARRRAAKDLGLDRERTFNLCFALLFVGLAGARLLHVVVHYAQYAKTPLSFLYIWDGGLSFYGGLIAALLWAWWWLSRHPEMRGAALLDRLAAGAALALAIGCWGSFLSGDGYGEPSDVPWAITFPFSAETQAPRGVALHPTQIYASLHGLVTFAVLLALLARRLAPGRVTAAFLMLYAAGRAITEIWRGDDAARGMVIEGVLSVPQLISIPVFFAGIALWLIAPHRRIPTPAPPPA